MTKNSFVTEATFKQWLLKTIHFPLYYFLSPNIKSLRLRRLKTNTDNTD